MTLSYRDVMETDLSTLKGAASSWRAMGKKFETLQTRYNDHARDVVGINRWTGQGAMAAITNSGFTSHEFGAAQTQAASVAQRLEEGYAELHRLKEALKELVKEAGEKHYIVDPETGRVKFDPEELTDKQRDDPASMKKVHAREKEWNESIAAAVRKIDNEDRDIKRRLVTVVKDRDGKGDTNGFNGAADVSDARLDAQYTDKLADKIRAGGDVDPAVVKEAARLMRENAGDKTYSRTLLNSLGPDGVIDFTKRVQERGYDVDGSVNKDYRGLEGGFSRVLATGTKVPGSVSKHPPGSSAYKNWLKSKDGQWYQKFTDGLAKEGRENVGSKTEPLMGYQSLVGMMENGGAKFDDQFLYDLGDDIIAAEKKDEGIWTAWNGGHPGTSNDPLDGVLHVMSRDPDTATAFLDPEGNGKGDDHVGNDHLKYLLSDDDDGRKWPETAGSYGIAVIRDDDPTNRQGLAAALEAGTTGHTPGGEPQGGDGRHTAEQARVMQETITLLDKGANGDSIESNLQAPLARALADYAPDTHGILTEDPHFDYSDGGSMRTSDDGGHINVSQHALTRMLRGVSDEPESFALLYEAERAQAADSLATADPSPGRGTENWDTRARDAGMGMGTFNAIGTDVILDDRDERKQWADDVAKYAYHGAGTPVTQFPVLGDPAQRLMDAATYEWAKDVKNEADQFAKEGASEDLGAKNKVTHDLINEWASGRGRDPMKDAVIENMRDESSQSYITSRTSAFSALGRD